jgi:cyclopropane-fatty-acyl-phospholipid synthase
MLSLYGERAQLDGARHILELGCGWGSLTLWMAERHPAARITAVSNSRGQRDHILARCKERGLRYVEVITGEVNHLDLETGAFDRCVSVELLEHVRNYQRLLQRIASWLTADGKLFIHIFVHRTLTYPFETAADDDWMGRNFFTGGLMPAADTLLHFQDDVALRRRWLLSGRHYQRTADHWLQNQDRNCRDVMAVLCQHYGEPAAALWFQRWRMFWMACAELFGYRGGSEWMLAHYLFEPRARGAGR